MPGEHGEVPHICELQVKFVPTYLALEEGHSHAHYEYFRTYFSGGDDASVKKRMALLKRLSDSDDIEVLPTSATNDI